MARGSSKSSKASRTSSNESCVANWLASSDRAGSVGGNGGNTSSSMSAPADAARGAAVAEAATAGASGSAEQRQVRQLPQPFAAVAASTPDWLAGSSDSGSEGGEAEGAASSPGTASWVSLIHRLICTCTYTFKTDVTVAPSASFRLLYKASALEGCCRLQI